MPALQLVAPDGITPLCSDAHAPSRLSTGRVAKYSSDSASRHYLDDALDANLPLDRVPEKDECRVRVIRHFAALAAS